MNSFYGGRPGRDFGVYYFNTQADMLADLNNSNSPVFLNGYAIVTEQNQGGLYQKKYVNGVLQYLLITSLVGPKGDSGTSSHIEVKDIDINTHEISIYNDDEPVQVITITDGEDGVSPIVTITTITGGHRVTITDVDHPSGQSFDVLDGSGGGASSADQVSYNNIESGISAFNVQDAIDEIIFTHPSESSANQINYNNTISGLTSDNVQEAIDELVRMQPDIKSVASVNGKYGTVTLNQSEIPDGGGYVRTQNNLTNDLINVIQNAVSKNGDTIKGNITMSNNSTITGLKNPTNTTDAATKQYVDNKDTTTRSYIDNKDIAVRDYIDNKDTVTRSYIDSKDTTMKQYVDSKDIAMKQYVDATAVGALHFVGSISFINLPIPSATTVNNLYNITDNFITNSDFIEGADKSYSAGTNVAIINVGTSSSPIYKYGIMTGVIDTTITWTTPTPLGGVLIGANGYVDSVEIDDTPIQGNSHHPISSDAVYYLQKQVDEIDETSAKLYDTIQNLIANIAANEEDDLYAQRAWDPGELLWWREDLYEVEEPIHPGDTISDKVSQTTISTLYSKILFLLQGNIIIWSTDSAETAFKTLDESDYDISNAICIDNKVLHFIGQGWRNSITYEFIFSAIDCENFLQISVLREYRDGEYIYYWDRLERNIDETPQDSSENLVLSGGVKEYVDSLVLKYNCNSDNAELVFNELERAFQEQDGLPVAYVYSVDWREAQQIPLVSYHQNEYNLEIFTFFKTQRYTGQFFEVQLIHDINESTYFWNYNAGKAVTNISQEDWDPDQLVTVGAVSNFVNDNGNIVLHYNNSAENICIQLEEWCQNHWPQENSELGMIQCVLSQYNEIAELHYLPLMDIQRTINNISEYDYIFTFGKNNNITWEKVVISKQYNNDQSEYNYNKSYESGNINISDVIKLEYGQDAQIAFEILDQQRTINKTDMLGFCHIPYNGISDYVHDYWAPFILYREQTFEDGSKKYSYVFTELTISTLNGSYYLNGEVYKNIDTSNNVRYGWSQSNDPLKIDEYNLKNSCVTQSKIASNAVSLFHLNCAAKSVEDLPQEQEFNWDYYYLPTISYTRTIINEHNLLVKTSKDAETEFYKLELWRKQCKGGSASCEHKITIDSSIERTEYLTLCFYDIDTSQNVSHPTYKYTFVGAIQNDSISLIKEYINNIYQYRWSVS